VKAETLLGKVVRLAAPVVEGAGLELVDVTYAEGHGRAVLRVFIDKPGGVTGVTIDDCAKVSRELGAVLDVDDTLSTRYSLEVSSPGLDRVLKKEKDFLRFSGREVKIRTRAPRDDRRNFKGLIQGVENGGVVIVDSAGRRVAIPLEDIERANLVPEL